MTTPDEAFIADQMCFACGLQNPIGLKLTFRQEGEAYVTTFIAPREFQGYQGILHGGIVATLLDEVMARYVWQEIAAPAATARLEVRYRRPAPVGCPIEVRGWITGRARRACLPHCRGSAPGRWHAARGSNRTRHAYY